MPFVLIYVFTCFSLAYLQESSEEAWQSPGAHVHLPKEIWQHIILFLPIQDVSRVGLASQSFRENSSEPDIAKQLISRPNSRRLFSQHKERYWSSFLNEAIRQVTRASILSDLTTPLNVSSLLGLCVIDDSWTDLVPTLSKQVVSAEEFLPLRVAAASSLRDVLKLRSTYMLSDDAEFGSKCLDVIKSGAQEKLIESLLKLLEEVPIASPMQVISTALDSISQSSVVRSAALSLIGVVTSFYDVYSHFTPQLVSQVSKHLEAALRDESSTPAQLHDVLTTCANLMDTLDDATARDFIIEKYTSAVIPPLLDRFAKGAEVSLIVDAGLTFNLMTSLAPVPIMGSFSLFSSLLATLALTPLLL